MIINGGIVVPFAVMVSTRVTELRFSGLGVYEGYYIFNYIVFI
jgi:hypothetical protein